MDDLFRFSDAKHANIIHRCTQYISVNYKERITLEDTARMVYLSPAYLSRIFQAGDGRDVQRVPQPRACEQGEGTLRRRELRMTDISLAVGYEDQSYFTKVFKRVAGMLPREYREKILVSRKD